jgi:hypothetical protein
MIDAEMRGAVFVNLAGPIIIKRHARTPVAGHRHGLG